MQDETESYESRLRSILKALTYRIIGTVTTFSITFAVTGELVTAIAIGGVEPVVKMIVYYFHERAWQCVPHGSIRQLGHSVASKLRRTDKARP